MASITKKVAERLAAGIKRFQPILADAKKSGIGESDTVMRVTEILADVLGYATVKEITSEFRVMGDRCDLAIKLDGKVRLPIEVKAIGKEFTLTHEEQAVKYALQEGTEWALLTYGDRWFIYAVTSAKPPKRPKGILVEKIDFLALDPKAEADLEKLYLFTKEALTKGVLEQHHRKKQAMARYFLGAVILSDPVLKVVRKVLCKVTRDVKIEIEEIRVALEEEVLKREVLEGELAEDARKKIAKIVKSQKVKAQKDAEANETANGTPTSQAPPAKPLAAEGVRPGP